MHGPAMRHAPCLGGCAAGAQGPIGGRSGLKEVGIGCRNACIRVGKRAQCARAGRWRDVWATAPYFPHGRGLLDVTSFVCGELFICTTQVSTLLYWCLPPTCIGPLHLPRTSPSASDLPTCLGAAHLPQTCPPATVLPTCLGPDQLPRACPPAGASDLPTCLGPPTCL